MTFTFQNDINNIIFQYSEVYIIILVLFLIFSPQFKILRYQDVIVFIVGGGCYSEFYNLQVRAHVRVFVLTSFSKSYL